MRFRKFKADYIFTGNEILHQDHILITGGKGNVIDIVDKKDAGDEIENFNGMLTPGFINSHCHLELSHLKGAIPGGTGLIAFVQQIMNSRKAVDKEKLDAMFKAEQELYDSGTIAVGDICNTTDTIHIKQKSKLYWHNFIEVSGFVDTTSAFRLAEIKVIRDQFLGLDGNRQTSLSPHAPYSVSKTLFHLLNNETENQLITIHNQECVDENELYKNKSGELLKLYQQLGIDIKNFQATGKSSLQSWVPYFTRNQSIILVHNTFINQDDLDFIKTAIKKHGSKIHFCICINANKYIQQKVPPIELLRKNNCNIILGTDSYAGNWQLNILEEIKTIQHETVYSIPLEEILKWATINGAKALQMDNLLGSFEKNKQPGVVLINNMHGLKITPSSKATRII